MSPFVIFTLSCVYIYKEKEVYISFKPPINKQKKRVCTRMYVCMPRTRVLTLTKEQQQQHFTHSHTHTCLHKQLDQKKKDGNEFQQGKEKRVYVWRREERMNGWEIRLAREAVKGSIRHRTKRKEDCAHVKEKGCEATSEQTSHKNTCGERKVDEPKEPGQL